MKKRIAVLTAMLLVLGLTGCNNTTAKNNPPEPFSSSESIDRYASGNRRNK